MFCAVLFCGINTASSVLPYVTTERIVFYRERFSGMYAHWAYPLAQVTKEHILLHLMTWFLTTIVSWCWGFSSFFPFAGHNWDSLYLCLNGCIYSNYISNDWILLVSLQGVLVHLFNVLYFAVLQLLGNDANCYNTKLLSSCNLTIIFLHNIQSFGRLLNSTTGKFLFSLVKFKFLRIDERTYVKVFFFFFVLFSCRESQNGGFGYTI